MTTPLPGALAAYFDAKNRHDIDAMLASFAAHATVRDEGEDLQGYADIRAWMEKTTAKYRVTVEVRSTETIGEQITVAALVSGHFPGSPAVLHYHFTLASDAIVRLEIGA